MHLAVGENKYTIINGSVITIHKSRARPTSRHFRLSSIMKGSAAGVLPFYLDDSCATKREKTETESLDLKTEIQLSYVPGKPAKRFLGFLYEGVVPVAGGVEIGDIRDEGWGWPLLTVYLLIFSL
jgi:hypothetical protein